MEPRPASTKISDNIPNPPLAEWDCLDLSISSGEIEMQTDRELLHEIQSGKRSQPVLRFYAWNPPAVSFGHNQQAADSINPEVAQRLGYDVVQRPTGGRALLHKGDLCYAVISHRDWHPEFRTLSCTYRAISRAHRRALLSLGVTISESPETAAKAASNLSPCFAMINPFEVTVRGRKICGSAQYRAGDLFLQHGSLRVCDNWTAADLVGLWPAGQEVSAQTITSIEAELGRRLGIAEVAEAWTAAFAEQFRIGFR